MTSNLNRQIAERLGWRLEYRHYPEDVFGVVAEIRPPEHIVVRPDGSEFKLGVIQKYADEEYLLCLPDWAHDTGETLTLCLTLATERDQRVCIESDGCGTYTAAFEDARWEPTLHGEARYYAPAHEAIAPTPDEALCRLWLAATEVDA